MGGWESEKMRRKRTDDRFLVFRRRRISAAGQKKRSV
jgi:hypothetical protein